MVESMALGQSYKIHESILKNMSKNGHCFVITEHKIHKLLVKIYSCKDAQT